MISVFIRSNLFKREVDTNCNKRKTDANNTQNYIYFLAICQSRYFIYNKVRKKHSKDIDYDSVNIQAKYFDSFSATTVLQSL